MSARRPLAVVWLALVATMLVPQAGAFISANEVFPNAFASIGTPTGNVTSGFSVVAGLSYTLVVGTNADAGQGGASLGSTSPNVEYFGTGPGFGTLHVYTPAANPVLLRSVNASSTAWYTEVSFTALANSTLWLACNRALGSTCNTPSAWYYGSAGSEGAMTNFVGKWTNSAGPAGYLFNTAARSDPPTAIVVTPLRVADGTGACESVNWTAPASGPTPTGYSAFRFSGGTAPSLTDPMNSSSYSYAGHTNGLSMTVCHLTFAQNQWWAIASTNDFGEGIAGGPSNATSVAGPPSYVLATTGPTSLVVVNWSAGIAANASATGWSVFSRVSPEGTPTYPLNASGYAFAGHVDQPTHQFSVTSLSTNVTYCFRVESTNASAFGEGDIGATAACVTTGNVTLPPVLSGAFVPCSEMDLSWSLPNGTVDGYRVDQSTPVLPFVNRSFFVPPEGNFSLRVLNVSFPRISGELDYAVFAHSPAGYSGSSNVVNVTPGNVTTLGDCGLQWGGETSAQYAAQAGISVPAAQLMASVILIIIGAGVGWAAMGNGGGVTGGVGAGLLLSLALGFIPSWAVMFALVVGAGLGIAGGVLGASQRRLARGGLGRDDG